MAFDFQSGADYLTNSTRFPGENKTNGHLFYGGGSISFWMYLDGFGDAGFGRIVGVHEDGSTARGINSWSFWVRSSDSNMYFRSNVNNDSAVYRNYETAISSISTGAWINIVLTYNCGASSDSDAVVYIDGSLDTPNASGIGFAPQRKSLTTAPGHTSARRVASA